MTSIFQTSEFVCTSRVHSLTERHLDALDSERNPENAEVCCYVHDLLPWPSDNCLSDRLRLTAGQAKGFEI